MDNWISIYITTLGISTAFIHSPVMLSPQPWRGPLTSLYPSADFPTFNSPFFFAGNAIGPQKLCVVKENHDLYGRTSSRKLQVQDFLETVITVPSSEALEKLQRNGGMRTISDFNHLLSSLVSSDEFELALKVKVSLSSLGFFPDNRTYSILVNCHCKNNQPIEAKSVLYRMVEEGFKPDVATFTTLINSLYENGRLQDAYEVFDVMSKIACAPTINTYNCLLKGMCYVGRVEEAYALFGRIKQSSLKPDIYTYTALMDGFCKVGRTNEAVELLTEAKAMELDPNVATYNTLFNAFFKEGKPMRGFRLLQHMKERKCEPDYITYCTFLHGLLKWGKTKEALRVYREMVGAGIRVDERMMNTMVRRLCRGSRMEKETLNDVFEVYEEMKNGDYTIYQDSYELLIEAYCRGAEMEKVFVMLNEMILMSYSPKTLTFNICIRGLCRCGEVDKASQVVMMMHQDRMSKEIPYSELIDELNRPFNELILELNRRGRSLEARKVYGAAIKRGVVPKTKPRQSDRVSRSFCIKFYPKMDKT